MIKLAPSLLSADFGCLREQVSKVEEAGAELLHLDIMDGHFVPNITFGSEIVKSLRKNSNMIFDVHLMISDPDKYISLFAKAGADIISVHVETCTHLHRTIQLIKDNNVKAAVALNPATPLIMIEDILEDLDMVLLMSVNPGFGGQKFIKNTISKIEKLKKMSDVLNLSLDIEIDGGINTKTAPLVVEKGANVLVAGSAIFGQPDFKKAITDIRESINI